MLSNNIARELCDVYGLGRLLRPALNIKHQVERLDTDRGSFAVHHLGIRDPRKTGRGTEIRLHMQHDWFSKGVPIAEPIRTRGGSFVFNRPYAIRSTSGQQVDLSSQYYVHRWVDNIGIEAAFGTRKALLSMAPKLGQALATLHAQSWNRSLSKFDTSYITDDVANLSIPAAKRAKFAKLFDFALDERGVTRFHCFIAGDVHEENVLVERGTGRVVLIDLQVDDILTADPLYELATVPKLFNHVEAGPAMTIKAFTKALNGAYLDALPPEFGERLEIERSLAFLQLQEFVAVDLEEGRKDPDWRTLFFACEATAEKLTPDLGRNSIA